MQKMNEIIEFFNNIKQETIITILIAIGFFIIFKVFSSLIAYIIIKMFNMKKKNKQKIKENIFYKPIKTICSLIGLYLAILFLDLPKEIIEIIDKVFRISIIIIIANGVGNILNPQSRFMNKLKDNKKININDRTTEFIGKVIKAIIYVIAGFIIIMELGYDISGLITGLGLGSVVFALAAQDIAKNLCSGVVLLFDKPFMIGDYIAINSYEGTIEDMTFRAIRIRTPDNTLVSIPNSKISEGILINYSKMEKRRYKLDLMVSLEVDIVKIEDVIEKLRCMLEKVPNILEDSIQVHMDQILDNGININICFYTDIINYNEFLAFKESVNMNIMNLMVQENIELAYDTKTVYLKKGI